MNESQKSHLNRIQKQFIKDHTKKFIKGAAEHKTQLHEDFTVSELLSFALEEVQDLVSYLYTLEEILNELLDEAEEQNGIRICKNCGLA